MGSETVKLYVGPTNALFCVHKKLLCDRVPYFAKMFSGRFKEASETSASFPEDSVQSFDLLLTWVYYRKIRKVELKPKVGKVREICWNWINFYSLAEKFCIDELMDLILDTIRALDRVSNTLPKCSNVSLLYSKTSSGSPARKYVALALQYIIQTGSAFEKGWPTADIQVLLKDDDICSNVLELMRKQNGNPLTDPRVLPNCDFHHHGGDEPCPVGHGSE